MRNIEIKARHNDLDSARRAAAATGAQHEVTMAQTDTYFRVPAGRLKLREQNPGEHQLVFYRRPDQPGPKASDFQIVPVEDGAGMRALLSNALGVLTQVSKQREVWRLDNVRIHLDTVAGLGTFIEFEVMVIDGRSEAACRAQAENLLEVFNIGEDDLIRGSYADLVRGETGD